MANKAKPNEEHSNDKCEDLFSICERKIKAHKESIYVIIAILAIIGTIVASYLGADYAAKNTYSFDRQKSEIHEETVAKLIYLDLLYLNSTVNRQYDNIECQDRRFSYNSNSKLIIIGNIYPSNALYYSYRPEIASLNFSLANNITRFYNDMMYAEIYKNELNSASNQNNGPAYNVSYPLFKIHIVDAYEIYPYLIKDLKQRYNITDDIPISIYQYNSLDPCNFN